MFLQLQALCCPRQVLWLQVRLAEAQGAAALITFGKVPPAAPRDNASDAQPLTAIPAVTVKYSDGMHCFRTREHGYRCTAWLLSVRLGSPPLYHSRHAAWVE